MSELHGTCNNAFTSVRDAMAENFDLGLEVGASTAITIDGELVVDLWGGHTDEAKTTPWGRDTITNVWSTTKTMTALSALLLADRGVIDLRAPVARYWPEFAATGKERIEVRHLLSHTAGLSGWEQPITEATLYDWEQATALLAAQAPWWEPGSASGYHALTQGYLVGEVIRRAIGQTVGQFFAAELAGPLGADFHIGLSSQHDARVANVIPPPPLPVEGLEPTSVAWRTFTNPVLDACWAWTDAWRRAEIPAANGHGNARSVAQVQAVLACGGTVGGRQYLSADGCRVALEEQSYTTDLVLGTPVRFGMGYGLPCAEVPISPSARACYWGGWGGSLVIIDQEARMSIAYVMNKMGEGTQGDMRAARIVGAAYGALANAPAAAR